MSKYDHREIRESLADIDRRLKILEGTGGNPNMHGALVRNIGSAKQDKDAVPYEERNDV